MNSEKYYTLTGYKIKEHIKITSAMEDYIEMIYRNTITNDNISVKELSILLNVKASSVSKMVNRLAKLNLVDFQKYGHIALTKEGKKLGKFYLERHNTLTLFFKNLNTSNFKLEQVEKIEHFVDEITIKNMKKSIKKDNN